MALDLDAPALGLLGVEGKTLLLKNLSVFAGSGLGKIAIGAVHEVGFEALGYRGLEDRRKNALRPCRGF